MFNFRFKFFFVFLFILILLFFFILLLEEKGEQRLVVIGENTIKVEIADESEELSRGLSGRQTLADGEGMLFIFPEYKRYSFWMKGMNFPLDIIWIKDSKIVDILEDVPVPKGSYLATYQSREEINYVLEVKAGYVKAKGIKIGDKINLTIFFR